MRFKGLDLNLLVVFEALMDTRSTSRTALQLNLSQPAISAALGRLRQFFGDPILVLHGKRMLPTPFAEQLRSQVRECLRHAETLIATTATFDAATTRRKFRLVASDYVVAAVLAPIIRELSVTAPEITLELLLPDEQANADLEDGRIDLLITPDDYIASGHPSEIVLEENHVVVGCMNNPLIQTAISEADFLSAGHVAVGIGRFRHQSYADECMSALGKHRRVEVTVSSFVSVPWILTGTRRIAVMHERLARMMAQHVPIAIQPMPFDIPKMRERGQFHNARAGDEGLRWLLDRIRAAGVPAD